MKPIFKYILSLYIVLVCSVSLMAQELPVDIANISDQQLIQIINKYQLSGLSDIEFEAIAKQKGLSNDQIILLKKRMAEVDPLSNKNNLSYKSKTTDENTEETSFVFSFSSTFLNPKLNILKENDCQTLGQLWN